MYLEYKKVHPIIEKAIYEQLLDYADYHQIINRVQPGFRNEDSAVKLPFKMYYMNGRKPKQETDNRS